MNIKRASVEANLCEHPFKEGETLVTYAKRIMLEEGLSGTIEDISVRVNFNDGTTHSGSPMFIPTRETVQILVRMH